MPSYDYDLAVQTFHEARRNAILNSSNDVGVEEETTPRKSRSQYLQCAVETMEQLSRSCPLTPLLWIQYGATMYDYYRECCGRHHINSSPTEDEDDESNDDRAVEMAAYQLEYQTLQLGILEFPGSSLLQYRAIVVQSQRILLPLHHQNDDDDQEDHQDEMEQQWMDSIDTALQDIGRGSHRNEDYIVVLLYRLQLVGLLRRHTTNNNEIAAVVRQRGSCPMRTMNQNVVQELQSVLMTPSLRNDLDKCRQYEAQLYQPLIWWEDALEQSLYEHDGVAPPKWIPHFTDLDQVQHFDVTVPVPDNNNDDDPFHTMIQSLCRDSVQWPVLLVPSSSNSKNTNHNWGMGLGSLPSAQIVIQYVKAIKQQVVSKVSVSWDQDDNHDSNINPDVYRLIVSVYERGISECPCIELLWLSYIRELQSWITYHSSPTATTASNDTLPQRRLAMDRLSQVTHRAFRNCPYSITIWQQKLESMLLLATHHRRQTTTENAAPTTTTTLRPDHLITTLQEALDLGFLPLTSLVDIMKVFLFPIQIVKRHVLILLSEQQEQLMSKNHPEPAHEKSKNKNSSKTKQSSATAVLYYDDSEPINSTSKGNPSKRTDIVNKNDDDPDDDDDIAILDEVEGLVETMNEMYITIEKMIHAYMKMKQSEPTEATMTTTTTEVCAMLHQEHAQSELLLLQPLRTILFDNDDDHEDENQPTKNDITTTSHPSLQYFEKCIRCHNPPHPHSYITYIQYFACQGEIHTASSSAATHAYHVLCHLRQIRGLYTKAIGAVGRGQSKGTTLNDSSTHHHLVGHDYESSLQRLCDDWLNFERIVGTPRSYGKASVLIEKKLQKMQSIASAMSSASHTDMVNPHAALGLQPQQRSDGMDNPSTATIDSSVNDTKRKHETISKDEEAGVGVESAPKKLKGTEAESSSSLQDIHMDNVESERETISQHDDPTDSTSNEDISTAAAVKVPSKKPTVRVGHLDYPAHLYTIRVSNLSPETEDMDLVDTFRAVCGAIVHARIVREKHADGNSKGVSKGYGVIQFEQTESVEKALSLDDVLGIHEKLVKVERSQIPAVSLVPPGMHRVRPKGEGKVSKRNQKRIQIRNKTDTLSVSDHPNTDANPITDATNIDSVPTVHHDPTATSAVIPAENLEPKTKPSQTNITAFRPRNVHRGNQHPKPRLKFK